MSARKYTSLTDWLAVKSTGVDPGVRPIPERYHPPTSGVLSPPVPDHFPVSFSLLDKGGRARNRSRQVDQLLAQMGIEPRAS